MAPENIVLEHLALAAEQVGRSCAERFQYGMECELQWGGHPFESALEQLFWVWWQAARKAALWYEFLQLVPQYEVAVNGELYRLDFVVEPIGAKPKLGEWRPIAVEVDGHAFHERTPEQVALRDRRDRALQAAGWRVFHFSYREFTSNPLRCVEEVAAFAWQKWSVMDWSLSA